VDLAMAHATVPTETALADRVTPAATTAVQHPPVTPGKVAMWLFLATEIMFFTGLIGSYIVLRAGSPTTVYSNLYPPATVFSDTMLASKGVLLTEAPDTEKALHVLETVGGLTAEQAELRLHQLHNGQALVTPLTPEKAEALKKALEGAGATAVIEGLKTYKWPLPYDNLVNPLSIDLTAFNTFILICSSVTMVLALAALQEGRTARCSAFLIATVVIGSCFLGIQVYEYYQLSTGHPYPIGIGSTGHFRPAVSLFASCFYTMTGFHGAHVFGGVVMMTCIAIQSLRGAYSRNHYSPVELVGLYWHFVDLVWIILFTVVYLL
jgi:heme/copper-type cytochrome/quinol oxidase subunit 3